MTIFAVVCFWPLSPRYYSVAPIILPNFIDPIILPHFFDPIILPPPVYTVGRKIRHTFSGPKKPTRNSRPGKFTQSPISACVCAASILYPFYASVKIQYNGKIDENCNESTDANILSFPIIKGVSN